MNGGEVVFHFKGDTKDVDKKTSELGSKLKSVGGTIASTFLKGTAAVGTALTGMVGASVKAFADVEQSVGGVETLFKDSADTVIKDAKRAYKEAGISANEYMEQVTSFSASLLQSLGGDTKKAAEYAHRAVVDMSDNANKMGTNIADIQHAYQGFAKQNYTMLDNLKLGYGGTQEEMKRLIKDASKLTDVQKELNVSVKDGDMSFGNIVNAISVMQKKMDIAGTTSKEAATTISGSIGMAKAAFQNFLGGTGGIDEVVSSFETAGTNIAGAIVKMAPTIISGVVQIFDGLIPKIPPLIQTLLPSIVTGIVTLIQSLITQLPQIFSGLVSALNSILTTLVQQTGSSKLTTAFDYFKIAIQRVLPYVQYFADKIQAGIVKLMPYVVTAFQNSIPYIKSFVHMLSQAELWIRQNQKVVKLLIVTIGTFVATFMAINGIISVVKGVIGVIQGVKAAFAAFNAVMLANPIVLVIAGITALVAAIIYLWNNSETFRMFWTTLWNDITGIVTGGINFIKGLFDGIINFFKTNWKNLILLLVNPFAGAFALLYTNCTAFRNFIDTLILAIKTTISSIINFVASIPSRIWGFLTQMVSHLVNAFNSMKNTALTGARMIFNYVVGALQGLPGHIASIGRNLITGLWNGISDKATWVINKIKGLGNSVIKAVEKVFGVHSPSRVFAYVGRMNMQGFYNGMEYMQPKIQQAIDGMFDLSPSLYGSASTNLSPNVNVTNNISMKQDPLGQMVNYIKTFAGGSKNDYNYGMGG